MEELTETIPVFPPRIAPQISHELASMNRAMESRARIETRTPQARGVGQCPLIPARQAAAGSIRSIQFVAAVRIE